MFNRTNLTLSARTLSNRLNLGTRSLALDASVKNGGQTLRIRQTHHDVLREGMVWYDEFPNMPVGPGIPSIPGSFSQPQQCQPGCVTRQPGPVAEDVRVQPDPRPASLVGRPEPCVRVGVAGALPVSAASAEPSSISCERERTFRDAFRPEVPGQTRLEARRLASCQAAAAIAATGIGK